MNPINELAPNRKRSLRAPRRAPKPAKRLQVGYVGVFLGADLRRWLEERADKEKRTKSDLVRLILQRFRDEGGRL